MKRYKHNLSHYNLLTCDMGQLIPISCVEALPGDTIQHHSNVLVRVSPLAAPVMHPVTARVHHFFVPYRLLWEGWEDFITGGPDGENTASPPTENIGPNQPLWDYLGVPPNAQGIVANAFPIYAYNMIYNEFYRDQDLGVEVSINAKQIRNIAWEKDYFTTARPWTQTGPDITLPIGQLAPIKGLGILETTPPSGTGVTVKETGGSILEYDDHFPGTQLNVNANETGPDALPQIYADLATATGANINDVRRAFAIQRYQEARARYGSRYTEYLRYLGVNPKDSRLQRPEYLGGGHTQINFSEVMQTAPETGQEPTTQFGVGDMYGHGIAAMRSNKYRRFIEEHGVIMSLLSVRPKTMYTNGLHRSWLRRTKEDYYQKELENIGQQEVYNNEIYADPDSGEETFGYQDRYSEYREQPSVVCGEFRDLLNYWHMGREFQTPPALNQSFTDCVPTKRIHNEQTQHALWVMVQNKMVARRLVSRNAAPRII